MKQAKPKKRSARAKQAPKTTPVYLKSEFWTTFITGVAGLLMAFGVITKEQSLGLVECTQTIVGGILTLVSTLGFVKTQHAAKVAVFQASCAAKGAANERMHMATTQSVPKTDSGVYDIAKAVGL